MLGAVAAAPIVSMAAPKPQTRRIDSNGNLFTNNIILPRGDDGPLFSFDVDSGTANVRLDRYVIVPIERYGEKLT